MAALDIGKLDDIIHGRMRLGILTYLASVERADFNELKIALDATQGNLSVHLRKLEDAGYVAIEKSFLGRKPVTRARLTASGRRALRGYLEAMGNFLDQIKDL